MIENFGKNMARLRKEQNMTQIELGEKVGVNKQTISNIEKSIAYPSFNTLEKISNVLNANAIQLFGDERERTLFNATRQLNVLDEYHEKISDALKAEDIIYTIIKNENFREKLTMFHEIYTMWSDKKFLAMMKSLNVNMAEEMRESGKNIGCDKRKNYDRT